MKKYIGIVIIALLGFVVGGCAHHDSAIEHHHHDEKQAKYDGKCAYSMAHGELGVSGKPEHSFEHGGMTYYFSSEEKMNDFKKDVEANVKAASRVWEERGTMRR